MNKVFAPEYKRNEAGWILFPKDSKERKSMFFPPEVNEHPAKMNFHLEQAIIEYVAQPGDTLLDPFGGTGTLMIAALQGMRVILLEIEEGYHRLQQQAVENLRQDNPQAADLILLLRGDNRFLLPIPCNHIITSPPYASMMKATETKRMRENPDDDFAKRDREMAKYTKDQRNIGKLNNFIYNMAMEKVYNLCYKSILPGGTLTIILKDRIENQKRVDLTGWANRVCVKAGFQQILHEKWKTPGIQFTAINKMHGLEVVEDEDIMVYKKGG